MRAYTFLNIDKFVVAWEAYCGVMISTNDTVTGSIRPMSVFETSRFRNNDAIWYRNELIMEGVRTRNHPMKISRLTGMYFFEDRESAIRATQDERWGDGYYQEEYLAEVELNPTGNVTKVDHNWIFEKKVPITPIAMMDTQWIDNYWNGEIVERQEPLWELIAEGTAKIVSNNIREKALETIKDLQPETIRVLEISRIARIYGSQLGHIVSWIKPRGPELGTVVYIIKGEESNMELRNQIANYDGPVNQEFLNETQPFLIPDLSDESFDIHIS